MGTTILAMCGNRHLDCARRNPAEILGGKLEFAKNTT
ncbi:hypothetical protein ZEAMMB73_Zm00001d032674 [Zea mays]|uniref:Uncharacterized protein n=1 Tax=Zea mays TaxID=4577 RepID=A0A1D6KST6_MAIZE|nr:hypothetical protein ZEAMMB73_Zm00001d032674 [Zea mays]